MRAVNFAFCAALVACLAPAVPASAQFTLALPPRARIETETGSIRTTSYVLYPLAPFVANDALGVDTFLGGLVSIEHAIVPNRAKPTAYALGGWFWSDGTRDLYELHGKYYFQGDLGLQAGVVGSTKTSGLAYDAFVLYNLTPPSTARNYWNYQVGAGVFIDPNVRNVQDPFAGKRTITGFSGFIQGDTTLRDRLKLSVSYWYVENAGDFNRFAIGIGYSH